MKWNHLYINPFLIIRLWRNVNLNNLPASSWQTELSRMLVYLKPRTSFHFFLQKEDSFNNNSNISRNSARWGNHTDTTLFFVFNFNWVWLIFYSIFCGFLRFNKKTGKIHTSVFYCYLYDTLVNITDVELKVHRYFYVLVR